MMGERGAMAADSTLSGCRMYDVPCGETISGGERESSSGAYEGLRRTKLSSRLRVRGMLVRGPVTALGAGSDCTECACGGGVGTGWYVGEGRGSDVTTARLPPSPPPTVKRPAAAAPSPPRVSCTTANAPPDDGTGTAGGEMDGAVRNGDDTETLERGVPLSDGCGSVRCDVCSPYEEEERGLVVVRDS